MVVLDHFTFLGRGKTNHCRRNDYNLQQSDEEYFEDNVTGGENFKSNGFSGNNYHGQQGLRANRNFDRSDSKRPVSSSSRTAGTFLSSKQTNNRQSEQQRNTFSLSNTLPIHAQNPIFVEKFLPRFSSILPPSNLLAPETSVVKTPSTVLKRDFSENSLVPDQSNASHGFLNHHSKIPHNNFLTYESHFSKQPRGLIKGDSSTNRAHNFASASNDFSQGHENSHNKSPQLSFPIPSYNLPSIPLGCGESGSVNATFASISNTVTNGFRNSRNNSSNERSFKPKLQYSTAVNNPENENLNQTAALSLNSPSHRVQANYSQGLQENNFYSIAALEKGSRNNSGVSNQCRKGSSKVPYQNTQKNKFSKFPIGKNEGPKFSMSCEIFKETYSQNLIQTSSSTAFMDINMMSDPNVHNFGNLQNNYDTNKPEGFVENGKNVGNCGKEPVGDPNFLRSNSQSNLVNIQPSAPNYYASENSPSRSVSKSKSKTDLNKTNLVNIMKEFGFGFNDRQENCSKENTNSSTTISNPVDTDNFSLGSTLLSQLDTFESDGHRKASKLSKANLSNYHNSGLPKPDTVADLKSNYSNKNESKLLPLAQEPSKRNKAVFLEIPRQVEDISRAANYQRPSNITNENYRDFPSDSHKQNNFQSENNIRSFDSTKNNCENIRLTDYTLTGQSFNIRQPARDLNHRAPSRTEVLERIEADYAVKAVEHAEKERLVSG